MSIDLRVLWPTAVVGLGLLLVPSVAASEPASTPPAAAIASAHPKATEAGRQMLEQGGNAFDAAVATAAALAVVEPASAGLGGGGLWLLHRARDGHEVMIDARERAPLAATADMYLDAGGAVVPRASLDGARAAAIPGVPAAFVHIAARYGRLPLAASLAPAILLAREGFVVSERYHQLAERRQTALAVSPEAARIFLLDGKAPPIGSRIRQPELARVLERLAREGHDGFYGGPTAQALLAGVRSAGGVWGAEDLSSYRIVERAPLRGHYRGMRITSAALPSSGGVVLIQILNILQAEGLDRLAGAARLHWIIEAMRRAYRDRACELGDADYVNVDTAYLLDLAYAARLRSTISAVAATSSKTLPGCAPVDSGSQTTHLSILDREGNRVAATLTINTAFGSAFVAPGTGVLLNNEMDDFVVKPGVANAYGLVGSAANAIAPGKRPLSSMTPSFLETPEVVVILGTPGGGRIISMVLLTALEVAHGRGSPRDWVARPRFHHQYLPDRVQYESGALDAPEREILQRLGHRLEEHMPYGNMQLVAWYKRTQRVLAASDPRGGGLAWVER